MNYFISSKYRFDNSVTPIFHQGWLLYLIATQVEMPFNKETKTEPQRPKFYKGYWNPLILLNTKIEQKKDIYIITNK